MMTKKTGRQAQVKVWGIATVLLALIGQFAWFAADQKDTGDNIPELSLGPLPDVQTPQTDPKFLQATVFGHTYHLPCLGQEFLDRGWVARTNDSDLVEARSSAGVVLGVGPWNGPPSVKLPNDTDRSRIRSTTVLRITLKNTGSVPVPWEQAQVVKVETEWKVPDGPNPAIVKGMRKEDVIALFGSPAFGGMVTSGEIDNVLGYYGIPIPRPRLLDMGWTGAEHTDSTGDIGIVPINDVRLELNFEDDTYSGGYLIASGLNEPFDPDKKLLGSTSYCLSADDKNVHYSHQLFREFLDSDIWSFGIGRAAEYLIDGEAYVFGVSHEGECTTIRSSEDLTHKHDDYLLTSAPLEPMGELQLDPVSTTGDPYLLWSRPDSAAAVLVFRGQGERTGDDVVQVLLNYCDWERGVQLSLFFSVIAVEPGVAVSDGARNFLLSMVSDVANSVKVTS